MDWLMKHTGKIFDKFINNIKCFIGVTAAGCGTICLTTPCPNGYMTCPGGQIGNCPMPDTCMLNTGVL